MKLHHLRPAPGAHRSRVRKGRGIGSGKGKTAGRGTKGTGARTTVPVGFEGGQMPLQRRLPKVGGFTPPRQTVYSEVNVASLGAKFDAGAVVDPAALREAGLVRKTRQPVKILGRGDVGKALTVKAHAFSSSAAQKIQAAGGSVEVL